MIVMGILPNTQVQDQMNLIDEAGGAGDIAEVEELGMAFNDLVETIRSKSNPFTNIQGS
jgi:hypothetical protein